MSEQFYGRGLKYPMTLSHTAGLSESAGVRKVEESIRVILGTQHGERAMRPRFGCNLKSLVFAPNNAGTASLARHYVEEGLYQWEPRIEVLEVLVENDNRGGALVINIHYRVKATHEVRSIVYPFYLEQI